jgi:hypothetical protein
MIGADIIFRLRGSKKYIFRDMNIQTRILLSSAENARFNSLKRYSNGVRDI